MISPKMETALNDQINAELYSSYLYLAMAAYFDDLGMGGFSSWMKAQAQEEVSHAMKFFNYVGERGGRVTLGAIQEPPKEWTSTVEAFEASLEHEKYISGRINDLVNLAIEEKDHATNNFLQWFVSEQVEEEDSVGQVVDKLKLMGQAAGGIFMLDRELGQRTFTMPAEGEE
jgi:ferritin